MAKLRPFAEDTTAYRDMSAAAGPRGPIWNLSNPGIAGMRGGEGVEAVRFHNRLVDLMREAFPATADELLAEWEAVFGLPLCDTAPATNDERRAALAGRVAAQGGQSRGYFLDLIWAVLEAAGYSRATTPELVTIEELPYGVPFQAWGGTAWQPASPATARFYWAVHLPDDLSEALQDILECLLERFKPAHTVLLPFSLDIAPPSLEGPVAYRIAQGSEAFIYSDHNVALGDEVTAMFRFRLNAPSSPGTQVLWADDGGLALVATMGPSFYYLSMVGATIADLSTERPYETWALMSVVRNNSSGDVELFIDGLSLGDDNVGDDLVGIFSLGDPTTASRALLEFAAVAYLAREVTMEELEDLAAEPPEHPLTEPTGLEWGGEQPPLWWSLDFGATLPAEAHYYPSLTPIKAVPNEGSSGPTAAYLAAYRVGVTSALLTEE